MQPELWAPARGAPIPFRHQAARCGAPPSAMPMMPPRHAPAAGAPKSSVLVVEDEPMIRILMCDLLEGAGLGVEEASDADGALELLPSLRSDRNRCPVLVTDVNLGAGLDGISLAEEARRSVPGLRVLYVTGNPERVRKQRPTMRPEECVLGKPFRTAELVETVRWLMAPSAASA